MVLPLAFIIGTAVGSFLNVLIFRYHTGVTLSGRSHCPSCAVPLRVYELIPIVSFLIQRGRCRRCKSRLSLQYPAVEILSGLLFLGIVYQFFPDPSFSFLTADLLTIPYHLVVWCLLLAIAVYDLRHRVVPDGFVYPAIILTLFALIPPIPFAHPVGPSIFLNAAAGPILALPLSLLWLVSRGKWMGLGDAKLALAIGWLLGFEGGIDAMLFSFWSGAFAGLLLLGCSVYRPRLIRRWLSLSVGAFTMKSEIPFAPFLVFGAALVFFFKLGVVATLF